MLLFFHSGARAADLCGDVGSVSGGLSLWPPGAECAGGEPSTVTTRIDVAAIVVLLLLVWPLQVLAIVATRGYSRRSHE